AMSREPPLNLADYEALAPAHMHPAVWDYISAGADDGVTMTQNRRAFERIALRPRVLADVSRIDTRAVVLGAAISSPILIAPTGPHAALCPEGEVATAEAAGKASLGMVASSRSNRTIEDIAAAATGPLWLQLYLFPERERTLALVRRAEAAGCGALVLTADSPRFGRKEQSLRTENEFDWPEAGNLAGLPPATKRPVRGAPATWEDLDWLRDVTRLPIVLKGVLTAEDAAMAVERQVAGIVVSNHGGRQLDGAIASIEALPEVAAEVGGRAEIYLDGGIRRGTDVLKALALGARAVMIGRPVLWGLAVAGAAGALDVLEMLKRELEMAMALAGRPTLTDIDASLVWTAPAQR
ncbi:MAG TPA: alpha-hydroxy acid oxidase, partial [Caulobacteraceae bacterium]|nr:alpha-hydroxy acid oxidase [Caulobacteraceae bacterium]